MAFKDSLHNLRNEYNLTQMEFAKKIGVTTGMLAEWESGESEPNLEQLAKISSAFNISLDKLISSNKKDYFVSHNDNNSSLNTKSGNLSVLSDNSSLALKKKKKLLTVILLIIIVLILASFTLIFFITKPTSFSDDPNAISQAENSLVKIYCYDFYGKESATGSGFVAFDGQTVITNYHVACEGYKIKISTDQDNSYDVDSIITYSEEKDICILKLTEDTGIEPLTFGNPDDIKKGENVIAIGSPLRTKNSVSKGVLSGKITSKDFDVLQFTASISSGSSGGALFNDYGEVIGVTFASYENGQNLNLAIPINVVSDLYNNKGMSTEPELLYKRTYPYVDFLKKSVETTIKDLNNSPSAVTGNCIIKSVYISSFNGENLETSTQAFITDRKSSVSGDFIYDKSSKDKSLLCIQWDNDNANYTDNSMVYCDESLAVGSFVTVILDHMYYDLSSLNNNVVNTIYCKAIISQNE